MLPIVCRFENVFDKRVNSEDIFLLNSIHSQFLCLLYVCNNESLDTNCDKNLKHYDIISSHKSPACFTWVCNEVYNHSDVAITNNVSC